MIPPAEYLQLLNAIDNGPAVSRPARRRLLRDGYMVVTEEGPTLTEAGHRLLLRYAPRSPWSPPKQQGPQERRLYTMDNGRLSALTLAAAIGAISPRR